MKLRHEHGPTKHLLDLNDIGEMCTRIRYACLKQDTSSSISQERPSDDLIHVNLTEEELDDLSTMSQPSCGLSIRAFLHDLPCLLMDITGNRYAFRLTLPLWQPRVASWLNGMDSDEMTLVLTHEGQTNRRLRAELALCPKFKEWMRNEHQRTCLLDQYQSTDWMVQSGLMSMIDAELGNPYGKPLRHSVIAQPDVEELILDAYRISAKIFENGDVSALTSASPHKGPFHSPHRPTDKSRNRAPFKR